MNSVTTDSNILLWSSRASNLVIPNLAQGGLEIFHGDGGCEFLLHLHDVLLDLRPRQAHLESPLHDSPHRHHGSVAADDCNVCATVAVSQTRQGV